MSEAQEQAAVVAADPTNEMRLDKKAVFGWAMFDFANSSFTTVMVTAYFSVYFATLLVPHGPKGPEDYSRGYSLWGLASAVSQIIVMLTAPIVGALADFSGSKKKFLFVTYIGCSVLTMTLGWVHPGQVAAGFILFVVANVFYSSGENIVGAFLPEIAPARLMGFISGFAWGLGYIGGIGALLASVFIIKELGIPKAYPFIWVMIGLWFLLSGIPTFIWVKERPSHEKMPPGHSIATVGFHRLYRTYRESRHFRQLFRFLLVFVLIYVGVTAVISFATIIAKEVIHLKDEELGYFLIITNLVAVFGAWTWGWLQDRIGSVWAIRLSLVTWLIALGLVLLIPAVPKGEAAPAFARNLFWGAGCFVGIGLGATSSSCRALVGIFSPPDRAGEFFGLWGFFGKIGSAAGPFLFGLLTWIFSMKVAIIGLGVFFVLSMILMSFINEKEGRAAALTSGVVGPEALPKPT